MAKMKRSTRQATKVFNESLNLYNFEASDECVKLSFSPDKSMNSSVDALKNRRKEKPSNSQVNAIKQSSKYSARHVMKSPSFEFFSKKLGRSRKSDSGVFMTPSPILRNVSSSKNETPAKQKAIKRTNNSGNLFDEIANSESLHCNKQNSKVISKIKRKSNKMPDNSKNSEKKMDKSLTNLKNTRKSNQVKVSSKEPGESLEIKSQIKEHSPKPARSGRRYTRKSERVVKKKDEEPFLKPRLGREQKDVTLSNTRTNQKSVKSTRQTASSKLKRNQRAGLRKSTPYAQRSLKHSTLSLVRQISINKHHQQHNNVLVGPTSTPNVVLKPNRKSLMGSCQSSLTPPKVSPVLKFTSKDGVVHGEVITSPTDLGSPRLKRITRQSSSTKKQTASPVLQIKDVQEKVKDDSGSPLLKRTTRYSVTVKQKTESTASEILQSNSPVLAMSKMVYTSKSKSKNSSKENLKQNGTEEKGDKKNQMSEGIKNNLSDSAKRHSRNASKAHQKIENNQNIESFNKKNKNSENKPSVNGLSNNSGGKKRKSPDNSIDNDINTNKKVKASHNEEQMKLSMTLFEDYSPVKSTKAKKKSPPKQTTDNILDNDEANCSILDISKCYNPNSFSQSTGSYTKKQKGRYSTSKIDLWAQQKNEEFDEFEDYELSME